jgi:hypothetical protein
MLAGVSRRDASFARSRGCSCHRGVLPMEQACRRVVRVLQCRFGGRSRPGTLVYTCRISCVHVSYLLWTRVVSHPVCCTNQIEWNYRQVMEKSTARKALWLRSSGGSLDSRNRVSASDPDKELIGHVTHITRVTLTSLCSPTLLRTCQLTPLTTLLELSRALSLSLSLLLS